MKYQFTHTLSIHSLMGHRKLLWDGWHSCAYVYGCELWLLTNCNIEALCVAWRKTSRRIWNWPCCTHSRLLPLVCNCLPLFDEICRTCVLHDSSLIRFVVQYGVLYARSQSILGQIVLFCTQRYHRSINDVIYNQVNSCIITFAYNSVDYETHLAANLLTEALMLRDCVYCFSNGFSLSHDEPNDIINYICI